MPVTTRGLVDQIKKNEGHAAVAPKANRLGESPHGAYIGHGRPEVVEKAYEQAGVSREDAGELYGKEIVVGYGHMLQGKDLKDYFTDATKKQHFNNLSSEDAEGLLNKDVRKHQKHTDQLLEEHKIKPETLTKSQYNALTELTFQLGKGTFSKFKNFWEQAKQGDWEEAAQELKYGKTRKDYSNLYRQTKGRTEGYMRDLQQTEQPFEGTQFATQPVDTGSIPLTQEVPASAGIPSDTSPTFNTPEEENQHYLDQLGIAPEDIEDENARYLQQLGIAPEDIETQTQPTPDSPSMGQGEAAARTGIHGATFGLPKKVAGLGTMLSEGINRLWPEDFGDLDKGREVREQAAKEPFLQEKDYVAGQKEYQDKIDQARKDWKKTSLASELMGGIASGVVIPGSTILKGAGLAKKMKTAATLGGAEGAVYSAAESDATEGSDLARDALIGGLTGATAGAAFGGILHGGGKLYKKMKGVDTEDIVKANMLDDKSIDVALVGADKRARKELQFNKEILKSIKGFTDKQAKDQFRFLNMKVKNAPAKIQEWSETVTPEALLKYSAEEPLDIPNSIQKLAKKKNIDPKLIHAYYNWRNDIFNYMKYINDIGGRAKLTRKDLLKQVSGVDKASARTIQSEIPTFKKNMKAGLVNNESYSEYKMQQYLAEEMQNLEDIKVAAAQIGYGAKDQKLMEAVEQEARELIVNDPMKHKAYRKLATVSNAAEVIDDKAGTRVLDTVQDLYVADKQKTGFTRGVADLLKPAIKMRDKGRYADMSDEDIVKMIERGDDDPLANAYRKVFKEIRDYANDQGVKIDEYALGQDKYVPMKRKGAAELIESMEEKWVELKGGDFPIEEAEINKILGEPNFNPLEESVGRGAEKARRSAAKFRKEHGIEDFTVRPDEELGEDFLGDVAEVPEKMPEYASDIRYLQKLLSDVYGREIRDAGQMGRAIKNLRKKDNIRALIQPSVRNVHERQGSLPMWARETDIGRMATIDASSIGDLIYKRPVLDKLDTQITLLKMKGFANSADYLNNLKKDILGITRKGTEDRQIKSVLNELTLKGSAPGKLVLGLENAVVSALYPNFLGFNARAIVRNLTQPYTMTTRELGVGIPGDLLALNSTRKIMKEGLGKAQKRFSKLGLVDVRDPRPEDFEGVRSGLSNYFKDNKWARRFDKGVDKYSHAAMYMYGKTDTINRLVTAQMAEDIAKLVSAGKTKWLKNAPQQVRNKVQQQIDEGASVDDLTQTIGKWMQTKTQLSYAKDDMYEFGREMGPLFAMLSKWPSAVTSDIATKIMKDGRSGATRAAMKYLMPLAFTSMLQNGLDREIPEGSAQSKEMFGYDGLKSFLPVNSVFGITDAIMPIPIQAVFEDTGKAVELGADAMSGRWDKQDTKALERVMRNVGERFVPVAGGVHKAKRHWEGLIGKTDKDRKKKKKRSKKYLD
jgi:GH24 family phage-related lysozyme (muramidase)